jgi:hypothetical protein
MMCHIPASYPRTYDSPGRDGYIRGATVVNILAAPRRIVFTAVPALLLTMRLATTLSVPAAAHEAGTAPEELSSRQIDDLLAAQFGPNILAVPHRISAILARAI